MVSRVTLVASEIDSTIDLQRKILVYLHKARVVALVPVVAGPVDAIDELQDKTF